MLNGMASGAKEDGGETGGAEAGPVRGTGTGTGGAGGAGGAGGPGGAAASPGKARRAPAGAAVLREDVTEAIRAAVFAELAAVGYGRMSIEGVARRAGVGKTAVYRRWRSKLHLVLDLVSAIALQGLPAPDTGSLETDLHLLYEVASRALRHPAASQIVPDLFAEAARNPDLQEALEKALREAQRSVAQGVLDAAAARGEVRAALDRDLALDLITGPLYWRVLVVRTKTHRGYPAALAKAVAAGLRGA
ncbi:TetR/AcrR family transcriptional regulator [Streptomyces sp. NPDC060243]|uniref:TetR/AcrR family transcriptional regulator n=1 Tax=Streptomyces sp. NPDC060243 TaxID=3347081 RepID=UPI003659106A